MKIYEIEAGQKISLDATQLQNFIDIVRSQCSDALRSMKIAGKFLYRGFEKNHGDMFHGRPREDRRPLAKSRIKAQKMIDIALAKQGIQANRSNSIFCSGDYSQAAVYTFDDTDVYLIFPTNGFKFAWSPYVRDLLHDSNFNWATWIDQSDYDRYIEGQEYIDIKLDQALISGYEIMIHGEYYAIRSSYQTRIAGNLFK